MGAGQGPGTCILRFLCTLLTPLSAGSHEAGLGPADSLLSFSPLIALPGLQQKPMAWGKQAHLSILRLGLGVSSLYVPAPKDAIWPPPQV